ncbi:MULTISPECIES: helix-turn-helix transcriptional regulator [Methylobacterium]|uniref:helix-turn-helix transcriptional regulator n=1 Tax=Methylobacterium TaxID=407 RepID=UPI00272EA013|nr:helix-turn-helix domain-containing protein [Methylobacterium sp.]
MPHTVPAGDVRPNACVVNFNAACEAANLSISTMRRLVKAGRGPRILRLSERRIGIRRDDLDEWINSRTK